MIYFSFKYRNSNESNLGSNTDSNLGENLNNNTNKNE